MVLVLPAPLWVKEALAVVLGIETTKLLPLEVLTQFLLAQAALGVDAQADQLTARILSL